MSDDIPHTADAQVLYERIWLAHRDAKADIGAAGARLETAILATLADSTNHTPDLGGSATTTSFTDAVIRGIAAD